MTGAFAAPAVLIVLGSLMFALAQTQPAWVDGRIGPGLFAQWLSAAVVALSVLWAGLVVARIARGKPPDAGDEPSQAMPLTPGVALLAAVLVFILLKPFIGLVGACGATAMVAGWGAGDRDPRALALTGLFASAAALLLGSTLLPPATRLWPWGPFGHG